MAFLHITVPRNDREDKHHQGCSLRIYPCPGKMPRV